MSRKWLVCLCALLCMTQAAHAFVNFDISPEAELIYRVNLGRADDVRLLLDKGVSTTIRDYNERPLVILAASRKDEEALSVLQALVKAGADVNATDTHGQTALFYAARNGNAEIVSYLLLNKIEYYRTDNQGNIARTIAFQNGYMNIVELMDNFVRDQTSIVQKQYEEVASALEERYQQELKQYENTAVANQQLVELIQKQEQERKNSQLNKQKSEGFKKSLKDMAYHSCAFQYWSYCRDVKASAELNAEELSIAIDTNQAMVASAIVDMITEYQPAPGYVEAVSENAKSRIFTYLDEMPSNQYRKKNGICFMQNMKERCQAISHTWSNAQDESPSDKAALNSSHKR